MRATLPDLSPGPDRLPAPLEAPVLPRSTPEALVLLLALLLLLVAVALGVVGVTVKGLLWLLFIGIAVLLVSGLVGALHRRR